MIAHRLSTIQDASQIIYLDEGIISASGTFDERKNAVLTTLKKSEEFLASICLADERKAPWDITRTTEIRPLTDDAFRTLIHHVESMVNDAGIVV